MANRMIEHFKIEVWLKSQIASGAECLPAIGFSKHMGLPVENGFVFLSDVNRVCGLGFPLDDVHHYKITPVLREGDNAPENPPRLP